MAANLHAQTGRSVDSWVQAVNDEGLDGFRDVVAWLKEWHGLGHFQARLVAEAHRDQ